jgi:hypothetical protein
MSLRRRRLLLSALMLGLLIVVGACAGRPTPTPQPTFTPTPNVTQPSDVQTYNVNIEQSLFRYQATGNGLLGAMKIPGTFKLKEGKFTLTPEESRFRISAVLVIDVDSATAVDRFTLNSIKGSLEVEKYPLSTFAAASKETLNPGDSLSRFTFSGTLDLHGRIQQIEFPFLITITDGNLEGSGNLTLDLFDFNVNVPTAFIKSQLNFTFEVTAKLAQSAQ